LGTTTCISRIRTVKIYGRCVLLQKFARVIQTIEAEKADLPRYFLEKSAHIPQRHPDESHLFVCRVSLGLLPVLGHDSSLSIHSRSVHASTGRTRR
jgi:hypothetical protein